MKRLLVFLFAVLVVFLLLVTSVYFYFEKNIKHQLIPYIKEYIQEESNMKIDFSQIKFSFDKLIKLEPTLIVTDINVEDAVHIDELYVELYLKELLKKKFEIKSVVLTGLDLQLEENSKKEFCVKGFEPSPKARHRAKKQSSVEAEFDAAKLVETVHLRSAELRDCRLIVFPYLSLDPVNLTDIDLKLSNFILSESNDLSADYILDAELFHSERSSLSAKGKLGPVNNIDSLVISGKQKLNLYLADLPEKTRKAAMGEFLVFDDVSRVELESKYSGDVLGAINGEGTLLLKNLVLGLQEAHSLKINSQQDFDYQLSLVKNPSLRAKSLKAMLDIESSDQNHGKLEFDTYFNMALDTGMVQGSSSGSLKGLEIREVLNSVSEYRDLISGDFNINGYQLYFKGKDAEEMMQSLKGNGLIEIKDGSLYLLNSLSKYTNVMSLIFPNAQDYQDKLTGKFIKLGTKFRIKDENLYLNAIELDAKTVTIDGHALIRKGQHLNGALSLNVARLAPVPISLGGTIESPRIKPDMRSIGKQKTETLIDTLLQLKEVQNSSNGNQAAPVNPLGLFLNNLIQAK